MTKHTLVEEAARAVDFAIHFANAVLDDRHIASVRILPNQRTKISIPVASSGRLEDIADPIKSILSRLRDSGLLKSTELEDRVQTEKTVRSNLNSAIGSKVKNIEFSQSAKMVRDKFEGATLNIYTSLNPSEITDLLTAQVPAASTFMQDEINIANHIVEANSKKRSEMVPDSLG